MPEVSRALLLHRLGNRGAPSLEGLLHLVQSPSLEKWSNLTTTRCNCYFKISHRLAISTSPCKVCNLSTSLFLIWSGFKVQVLWKNLDPIRPNFCPLCYLLRLLLCLMLLNCNRGVKTSPFCLFTPPSITWPQNSWMSLTCAPLSSFLYASSFWTLYYSEELP